MARGEILSAENPELSNFLSLKTGLDLNIALHVSLAARNSTCPCKISKVYFLKLFTVIIVIVPELFVRCANILHVAL